MDLSHNLQLYIRTVNFIETMYFKLQMMPFIYILLIDKLPMMGSDQMGLVMF